MSTAFTDLLVADPILFFLMKITSVLTIGWVAHLVCYRADPRWRNLTWRMVVSTIAVISICEIFPSQINVPVATLKPSAIKTDRKSEPATLTNLEMKSAVRSSKVEPDDADNLINAFDGEASATDLVEEERPMASTLYAALPKSQPLFTTLYSLWLLGVLVLSGRLAMGVMRTRWLLRRTTRAHEYDRPCKEMAGRLGLR